MQLQNWHFLETFPDGPILDARDIAIRVQLRGPNVGFMEAHWQITALRLHAGHPADLGHAARQHLPVFFVQVESQDLRALAVPPYMEQLLITKYKLKNNGPPVKVCLYLGQRCEWKVQLQWTCQRVGFIKSLSEFAAITPPY